MAKHGKCEHELERVAMYNSKLEFLKESIKYMFLANGGAITTLLLKFDVDKFIIPLYIFTFGVLYTIFIPVFMYFKTKNMLYLEPENKINNVIDIKHNKYTAIFFRFVTLVIIYIPMLIFFYGIDATFRTHQGQIPLSVPELLGEMAITVKKLLLN